MRNRILLKLLVLGGISILLLIALSSIGGITRERKQRLFEVERNIAKSYAGSQRIVGPVIAIEYRERWISKLYNKDKDSWYDKEVSTLKTALVYPEQLNYDGVLHVQERYRGIFKANVFQSEGHIAGSVKIPEADHFSVEQDSTIELVSAKASILISDPRGISRVADFNWGDTALEIIPGSALKMDGSGVHAIIPGAEGLFGLKVKFSVDLNVHGMGRFEVVPIGSENRIRLKSPWLHPSFIGDFLATDRVVTEDGFTAEWNVNSLACSAQQVMDAGKLNEAQHLGVALIDPINPYPLTDRALKYGFLFIFITFAAFFLYELVKQLRIHPIQYGFVGLAQSIFFLLLLSLSEHMGFGISYLVASAATIGLICIYLYSVLKGWKRGVLFGVMLAFLYGALYGLLRSEDHALVAGSALLFGLLTLVMISTRKLDWYALSTKSGE
ncbi:MAG: cell envelope integrity protein CreD [Pontiella sp.]